ncbi:MAG: DUF4190 domain-containing protein [Coriobacteriales bacterium]|nr:DUF4190 domain-containing protein [Coriobacteriales bacterium]
MADPIYTPVDPNQQYQAPQPQQYQAPQAQYQAPQQYYQPQQVQSVNKKPLIAMILGIISLIAWFIPIFGYATSIPAIILGVQGRQDPAGKGKATAGMVMGIIGLVLSLINSVLGVILALQNGTLGIVLF